MLGGWLFRSTAVVLAVAPGALGLGAAPALAAEPLHFESPSPLIRQHLPNLARAHALPPSASPWRKSNRRAHLFPCREAAPDGRCGRVRVPLDRAHPSRGSIPIFFEYFRHRAPGPTKRAILTTEGGPGGSITQGSSVGPLFLDAFGPLLRTRDLILLDQRGAGAPERSTASRCSTTSTGARRASTGTCALRAAARVRGVALWQRRRGAGHQRRTARAGDQKA